MSFIKYKYISFHFSKGDITSIFGVRPVLVLIIGQPIIIQIINVLPKGNLYLSKNEKIFQHHMICVVDFWYM